MANNSALINYITSVIRSNGNQEITGDILQGVLLNIVNRLGYQFAGIATPTTVPPSSPDANIWYLASAAGTYTNFNGVTLDGNTLVAFLWDGDWSSYTLLISGTGGGGTSEVTAEWVTTQISNALFPYATKSWVTEQGYLTSFTSGDIIAALGYTPLPNTTNYALGDAVGGNAINANKLGGNLPSYYAAASVVSALATRVGTVEGNITTLNGRVTSIEEILSDWFEFDAENRKLYLKKDANGNVRHFISYGDIVAGGDTEVEDPSTLTTLGQLVNVSDDADTLYSVDKMLIKLANSTEWTLADLSSLIGLDETALLAYLTTNGYAKKSDIPTIPTALPNPNALTFGNNSYDGSVAMTITASDLGLGNVENTALSTWAGSSYITKVGTITSGVWNGSAIANAYVANLPISKITNLQTTIDTINSNISGVSNRVTALEDIIGVDDKGNIYIKKDANGNARTFYNYGDIVAGGYAEGGSSDLSISYTPILETGTEIGIITINGVAQTIYAPAGGGSADSVEWSGILNKPTTLADYGITASDSLLANYVTSSTLSSSLSGYLPLSGGTISGNLGLTGYINTNSHYFFVRNNANADWIVTDKNWQNEYTLIHSGNIGSYNAGSATKLSDDTAYTAWGQTFFENGKPKNVSGDISLIWSKLYWGNSADNYSIGFDDDTKFKYNCYYGHIFYAKNAPRLSILNNGNVLIGTTTDNGAKLQVNGQVSLTSSIYWNDALWYIIEAYTETSGVPPFGRYKFYSGHIFQTASGEAMRINSSGNILIGTTEDNGYKLSVNGTLNATTIYQNGTTLDNTYLKLSGGTISNDLQVNGYLSTQNNILRLSGYYLIAGTTWRVTDANWQTEYTLIHSGNIGSQSVNYANSAGNAASATKLQTARIIWGQSFDGTANVSGAPSFPSYININRNPDTGALLNTSKIGVEIETYANYASIKTYTSSGSNPSHLTLSSSGNVLIGTTTDAGYKLVVNGDALTNTVRVQELRLGEASAGSGITQNKWYYAKIGYVYESSSPDYLRPAITLSTMDNSYGPGSEVERMRICANGNVSIGYTGNAGAKLYVAGNITATGEITAGSDIRYKSIQNDVILDTRAIANAPIFDFRWTNGDDNKLHLGTSAQYWLDYAPNAVTNSNDFYSLNYGVLGVAIGVSNARKLLSHEERIEQLEKENKQLKEKLERYGIE